MPNRKRHRRISMPPRMKGYKPFGIPMRELESVILLLEEYEAIRLADYENLNQEEAAIKMHISRPTFTRLYDKARKSIAKAFVEGKVIHIQGGSYVTDGNWYRCRSCNETMTNITAVNQCTNCDSEEVEKL